MGSENISRPTKYFLGSIQMFTDYFPTWTAIPLRASVTFTSNYFISYCGKPAIFCWSFPDLFVFCQRLCHFGFTISATVLQVSPELRSSTAISLLTSDFQCVSCFQDWCQSFMVPLSYSHFSFTSSALEPYFKGTHVSSPFLQACDWLFWADAWLSFLMFLTRCRWILPIFSKVLLHDGQAYYLLAFPDLCLMFI